MDSVRRGRLSGLFILFLPACLLTGCGGGGGGERVSENFSVRPTVEQIYVWHTLPGSEFEKQADMIILAMGFLHPRHEGLLDDLGVNYDPRGNVQVDDSMQTSIEGVYAAGDTATGAWLVVGAISGGRNMAHHVDRYLMGETALPVTEPVPALGV